MEQLYDKVNVHYERDYGVHRFETSDKQIVTVVSQPDWEPFISTVQNHQPENGEIILSPELMTSPYHLDELEDNLPQVYRRIIEMQLHSQHYPNATYLLGTITKEDALHNSLVTIRNGLRWDSYHKDLFGGYEYKIFQRHHHTPRLMEPNIGRLICADIINSTTMMVDRETDEVSLVASRNSRISRYAATLLVSSCWAVPLWAEDKSPGSDDRYKQPLETVMKDIFSVYPNINDVIMADRAIEISGTDGPFNAHFQRKSSNV